LIGFWHQDHANNDAARKAFIVNRVGDLGFLLGTFTLLVAMGDQASLSYTAIADFFQVNAAALYGAPLILAATLLLFVGCTGKSAQIPLMVWLPDAMAGPTPVSALIHAATMVTSGVFLLARLADVFALAPTTLDIITVVALATAIWAAIAGLFQWDIKKVLAYSTVSQLGFMFLAAGHGAFDVAMFHVLTHAFFKATLFLGAGSVIHALHHEQDMRAMGGLRKKMPVTFAAMFFAWYAIIGLPLGSGFFSKDLILEHALFDGGLVTYILALGAALITAIYMSRLMFYTFWSKARYDEHHPPREVEWRMSAPVLLLGFGSLLIGFLWTPWGHGLFKSFPEYLAPVVGHAQNIVANGGVEQSSQLVMGAPPAEGGHGEHSMGQIVGLMVLGTLAALFGLIIARSRYRSAPGSDSRAPLAGFGASWTFAFDRFYAVIVVKPLWALACILGHVVDAKIFEPALRGIATATAVVAGGYRWFQRRQLRVSLAISVVGVVTIVAIVVCDIVAQGGAQ
ncbi:MAG: NADH-quinone oxidoreductase subunit L, partial [Planctomycetota bacterium]